MNTMQCEHPELLPRKENGEIDYQAYIKSPEYNFLRDNTHLGDKICLIGLGGSRAYGTNLPDSDIDLRGIAINSPDEIMGLTNDFENIVDTKTDTIIYSLKKMVNLLTKCNPNTIEILGLEPEQYLYLNDTGKEILKNKTAFLSRQAIQSFGGYADAQYNRLEHNLLRNGENDDRKLKMVKKSLEHAIKSLNIMNPKHIIDIRVCVPPHTDASMSNITVSGTFSEVPIDSLKNMLSAINSIQRNYGSINKRNDKKDVFHLNKHMMHLIRLYLMGIDLNTTGQIIVKRVKEHDLLMSIRNGEFITEDGAHVRNEFFEMLHDIQEKYIYSMTNTVLPEKYDKNTVYELVRKINTEILLKYQDK